jgi:3'-5' exoribonuclease
MLNSIKNNQIIEGYFIVYKKEILTAKNGSKYLNLVLGDKSGQINAKMWDISRDFEEITDEDVVFVKGKVDKFKENLQIILEHIEKKVVSEDILNNLIITTEKNIDEMFGKLMTFKDSIYTKVIRKLIDKVFDEDFLLKFKLAPAATSFHHAYRGGLLEHTLSVVNLCDKFATAYENINRDILISGAILHDIGKVIEYNNKTFKRTDEGKLLGHIAIGITIVDKKAKKIREFPEKILNAIKHLILSHHGELEWGSPVQPATVEAVLLHYADNIDSKIQTFMEMGQDKKGWQYNKSLRRNVYLENIMDGDSNESNVNKLQKTLF